jgi:hypothetical protein
MAGTWSGGTGSEHGDEPDDLVRRHLLPALGSRRLAELAADEVDRWLAGERGQVSTDTLAKLLAILRQSIRRAQARDLVQRNVALLCQAPKGTGGRPSKSPSLAQANQLLVAAEGTAMHAGMMLVGDTGFEPVTSSVSAKIRPRLTAALSVASVRLSTCVIGPGRTDW